MQQLANQRPPLATICSRFFFSWLFKPITGATTRLLIAATTPTMSAAVVVFAGR